MLVLLDAQPRRPADFAAASFLAHDDARVRREALKLCLNQPAEREAGLVAGLADPDPQVHQLALVAAQTDCPAAARTVLIRLLTGGTMGPDQRALAFKVLGRTRAPEALQLLLRVVDGGKTWFGRRRLVPKTRDMLGALTALAAGWDRHPQARAMLQRAQRSSDPEVRAAAGGAATA
jgi:hypothetical protein